MDRRCIALGRSSGMASTQINMAILFLLHALYDFIPSIPTPYAAWFATL